MRNAIIIPTYNEKENIEALIRQIFKQHPKILIYVIDDTSPDNTGKIVADLKNEFPNLHLVTNKHRDGLGKAIMIGLKHAYLQGADKIITMDADFSHDPEHIDQMLIAADSADLVIGSRYIKDGQVDYPLNRRLLSFFANSFARSYLKLPPYDSTAGFRCYSKRALKELALDKFSSKGYVFQVESTYAAVQKGLHIKEIPIHFRNRRAGKAKMRFREIIQGAIAILRMKPR